MIRLHKKTIYEALGRGPVHPFPARMAPGIALHFVSAAKRPLRVLDPMMGSGTVIALARANGHDCIGRDIDPLAVLISKVWTTSIDKRAARIKARSVLGRSHIIFETLTTGNAYPRGADLNTRRFIRYWFDSYTRRQLTALSIAISRVRDESSRNILWCAFSRLIITKQAGASLAKDLAHSRPHRSFTLAPIKPFAHFYASVERVLENCISNTDDECGPVPNLQLGDARQLNVSNSSVDLVLTSPPYLNAIDYIRCSKFSLVWMGVNEGELRDIRGRSVGTEIGQYNATSFAIRVMGRLRLPGRLTKRHGAVLARFVEDMTTSMREVARVLAPGGTAIYVVGENTKRGVYIRNSKIIAAIAHESGLVLQRTTTRTLPPNRRYLPPPKQGSAALDGRMRREVILFFRKPARRRR
jgi:DNA modification methylase